MRALFSAKSVPFFVVSVPHSYCKIRDNISRPMIKSGKLKEMIGLGLRGMTSNPTIFDKAISSGSDYDEKIVELSNAGKSAFEIYDELTVRDVQDAADIFLPVYEIISVWLKARFKGGRHKRRIKRFSD